MGPPGAIIEPLPEKIETKIEKPNKDNQMSEFQKDFQKKKEKARRRMSSISDFRSPNIPAWRGSDNGVSPEILPSQNPELIFSSLSLPQPMVSPPAFGGQTVQFVTK